MHKFRPVHRYMLVMYRYNFTTAHFRASCTGTCLSCTGTTCSQLIFFFSHFSNFFFEYINIYIFHFGTVVPLYILTFPTAFHPGLCCMFTFSLVQIPQLTAFVDLVTITHSWDTFNLSIRSTAVPQIRIPKVRINLTTLSSKWVQGMRHYESIGMQGNNGL